MHIVDVRGYISGLANVTHPTPDTCFDRGHQLVMDVISKHLDHQNCCLSC